MTQQKARNRCFADLRSVGSLRALLPDRLTEAILRKGYKLKPVSFTNLGVIDHERLCFEDSTVETCYMTGTYRKAPDFQLTVSSFRGACTLNTTMLGDENDEALGKSILDGVKDELILAARADY